MAGDASSITKSLQSDSAADATSMQSLPPASANLAGSMNHRDKNFSVEVSNKDGYLCHTHVEARFDVPSDVVFALMSYPDNAQLFRDLKHVGGRKVLSEHSTKRVVQVEQLGEMRVLWISRKYSTWLTVTEDWTDPQKLKSTFELLSSDVLTKFGGGWEFTPVLDPSTGVVVGCNGVLHHDVLPKGVPSFLQHVPVLGGLLRGISMRAIRRLMEDINAALKKIKEGRAKGRETNDILQDLCGVFDAANPPPPVTQPVCSFALHGSDAGDDSTSEGHSEGHCDRLPGLLPAPADAHKGMAPSGAVTAAGSPSPPGN